METLYESRIVHRSFLRFLMGACARFPRYVKFMRIRRRAVRKGAKIGENVTISPDFVCRLNPFVEIGDSTSIAEGCDMTTLLAPFVIGSHVIIGNNVKFIATSHNIDSVDYEHITKLGGVKIEDYAWICPHAIILPSVKRIGRGAVIGAGSVVAKDVEPMAVVGGNPAQFLRYRKCVHSDLVVESLLGNDLKTYIKTWINGRNHKNALKKH